ncbi:site-specific integrase [Acidisphaera sp. L21]|uniref:tyrosine-type recombinase/integrase n=1 Tax=Acidisphaera sp. L21 TaxID=1641851 RepID=UPI00131EAA97|nr:site-specific integrase [Acidisphaera sp. L21]
MATITKRKNGSGEFSYQVKVRQDGKPTATRTFTKLAPGKAWGAATEAAMRDGTYAVGSGRTLAAAIDTYTAVKLPGMKDARMKAVHLAWWRGRLGKTRLRDLNRHRVALALDDLATEPRAPKKENGAPLPRAGATVNRYKANLSAVLSFAVANDWLTANPVRGMENRLESKGRERFLTPDERARLLAEAKASLSADLYLAVAVSLSTGGRQGEVLGLRWPHVDLIKGVVTFMDTKNGSNRSVPLVPAVVELLRERRRVVRLDTDLVFPGKKNPKEPIDLRVGFRAACARAAITGFRWHDQRHSAASAMADMGASLLDIGTVLGHRSQQTTKRYAHLTDSRLRDLVERAAAQHRVS